MKLNSELLKLRYLIIGKYEENTSDNYICCCEYVNYRGEKAHVLGALCDCEVIDNMAERCISRRSLASDQCTEIYNVIQDRARIPWFVGGARRIDLQIMIPSISIPSCLCIAAQGLSYTIIIFLFLAVVLLITYGWFTLRQPKTNFFLYWTFVSFVILMGIFQTQVVPFLEIRTTENFCLMLLVTGTLVTFYFVKTKTPLAKNETDSRNCFFHKMWMFKQDRHCLWINCCIGIQNQAWFIVSLFLLSSSAFYISNLIYTTLCQPVSTFLDLFLIPYDCSDVYSSFHTSLSFVSGIYASIIGAIALLNMAWELFVFVFNVYFKNRCLNF